MPIFDVALKRITIRGSIVGTRKDLAEAIAFAAEGKVHAQIHKVGFDAVLSDLRDGTIEDRAVIVPS